MQHPDPPQINFSTTDPTFVLYWLLFVYSNQVTLTFDQDFVKQIWNLLHWFIFPPCLCLIAEVYIGMSKPAEASACTQEAANLFPTSHNVLYMKGQIAELRGNIDEAKRWYEEALSINPTHVKSMQRLVIHRLHNTVFVTVCLIFGEQNNSLSACLQCPHTLRHFVF